MESHGKHTTKGPGTPGKPPAMFRTNRASLQHRRCVQDIMPLRRWHFGGDEVPQDAYTASPACQNFLQRHPQLSSTKDLKTYFVKRIVAIAGRHQLAIYGWEDAYSNAYGMPIEQSEMKTSEDVVSQVYYNTWEGGGAMKAYELANSGYKVCMCLVN